MLFPKSQSSGIFIINEIFIIGDTPNYYYRGLGEEINDLHLLRVIKELDLWLFHQVPSVWAQVWIALHHPISSYPEWTNWQQIYPILTLRPI